MFDNEEKKLLINLLCDKQTEMIAADHTKYDSDEYKTLERIKVKIKDM